MITLNRGKENKKRDVVFTKEKVFERKNDTEDLME